jgi:UDPglucose--hexose-1-phosphate uridylyltransferase
MQFDTKQNEAREMRQDIITEEWVVVATGRAKRPHDFAPPKRPDGVPKFKVGCPFCELDKYPQAPDVLRLPDDPQRWRVHIFGNKYPAFLPSDELKSWREGPYRAMQAVGYHEIIATRGHDEIESKAPRELFEWHLEAMTRRFWELKEKSSVNYIQIFKNYRPEAGQSLEHPHHQLLTVPILPNDVQAMLGGAERFARQHKKEVFAVILEQELATGKRIVWQNEHFVALCPYASRGPFEVWIVPRRSNPFFEEMTVEERAALAEGLQQVLVRLSVGLNDPPYNYYIHSAPCDTTGFVCDREQFKHFRWHIRILPRLFPWGGFELGTGFIITTAWPEESAAFLRDQRVNVS